MIQIIEFHAQVILTVLALVGGFLFFYVQYIQQKLSELERDALAYTYNITGWTYPHWNRDLEEGIKDGRIVGRYYLNLLDMNLRRSNQNQIPQKVVWKQSNISAAQFEFLKKEARKQLASLGISLILHAHHVHARKELEKSKWPIISVLIYECALIYIGALISQDLVFLDMTLWFFTVVLSVFTLLALLPSVRFFLGKRPDLIEATKKGDSDKIAVRLALAELLREH